MSVLSDVVWADVLGYVRTHYPGLARSWFGRLSAGPLTQGRLLVMALNPAQKTYLDEHCVTPFVEAAQAATGRLVSVEFGAAASDADEGDDAAPAGELLSYERETSLLRLNADYVFENFVAGPCNRLANAACLAVSDSPGTAYNPLFIHGDVGLGKTHLLQAVCHRILDRAPATRIMYLSCESFVNHFIEAVEKGALSNFRYRYRHIDVLLIDDIQFLAGHDRTQEEFFHTFNTLYHLSKQIILSADCPPANIPDLEERLVSRFNWGLVTRIDRPCLETRQAIIRKKVRMWKMDLPEDVATLIASRISANSRELEGALNRIHALATLEGRTIDLSLARVALGEAEKPNGRKVRVRDIMNIVTHRYDVKLTDLQGRRRSRSIAFPRQVCMYLARQYTHHSLEEIGGFFGGRDHTTVLHANKLIASRKASDLGFRSRLEEIEAALSEGA